MSTNVIRIVRTPAGVVILKTLGTCDGIRVVLAIDGPKVKP